MRPGPTESSTGTTGHILATETAGVQQIWQPLCPVMSVQGLLALAVRLSVVGITRPRTEDRGQWSEASLKRPMGAGDGRDERCMLAITRAKLCIVSTGCSCS